MRCLVPMFRMVAMRDVVVLMRGFAMSASRVRVVAVPSVARFGGGAMTGMLSLSGVIDHMRIMSLGGLLLLCGNGSRLITARSQTKGHDRDQQQSNDACHFISPITNGQDNDS